MQFSPDTPDQKSEVPTHILALADRIMELPIRGLRRRKNKSIDQMLLERLGEPTTTLADVQQARLYLRGTGQLQQFTKRDPKGPRLMGIELVRTVKDKPSGGTKKVRAVTVETSASSTLDKMWHKINGGDRPRPVPPRHMNPGLRPKVNGGLVSLGAPRQIAA